MQMLDALYGENNWKTPKINDYLHQKLISDERSKNIKELPFTFRHYFTENNTLFLNKSLVATNYYYHNLTGIELTDLPDIDL
jgi:hypothetical protein